MLAWEGDIAGPLLSRASWSVGRWLTGLRVEATFVPKALSASSDAAAGLSIVSEATIDGEPGFFGTRLRTGIGYLFLSADEALEHGSLVRRAMDTPGRLVVETELARIGTVGWPGRLYEVELLPPASMESSSSRRTRCRPPRR